MPFYSPSTGGFYARDLHGDDMPVDAVKITARKHAALLSAQAAGASIVAGKEGRPVAVHPTAGDIRAMAVTRVKREAKRRILAIASLERQSNDNAALAMAALATGMLEEVELEAALSRRQRIDVIRTASNGIEGDLNRLALADLTGFNPAHHPAWPKFEDAA